MCFGVCDKEISLFSFSSIYTRASSTESPRRDDYSACLYLCSSLPKKKKKK